MDDIGFGRLIRLARIRRGWRQQDLAERARVSRTAVSRTECGRLGELSLDVLRAIAGELEVRVEVTPRARATDLDRVVNARHSALAEFVAGWISRMPGWVLRPEVSFSEYGERGVVDLLCWHAASRALLVVEIKTELVDLGELIARLDVKHRLARVIARPLGWVPVAVSSCLLVADSNTNRRRATAHARLLRAALPDGSRELVRWLTWPAGEVRALRFVPDVRPGHVRSGFASPTRVRLPGTGSSKAGPRSEQPLAVRRRRGAGGSAPETGS